MIPIIAHCPYCNGTALFTAPGESIWCPCLAVRVSCDGLTGHIHVTITEPDRPADLRTPTEQELLRRVTEVEHRLSRVEALV